MNPEQNYIAINKANWNKRTEAHVDSEFYDMPSFLKGKNSLNSIELELLGDVSGKSILHLQCHFGQDTLSLARMGATCTGVDLSDKAIDFARATNDKMGLNARFVCCDVYDLPNHLDEQFDMVFTSYGTIGWLPDLDKWAALIHKFLKPGGEFVFAEFHPVIWMFDEEFHTVKYHYFNVEPIIETETSTYGDREAEFEQQAVSWNHSLTEVFTALLNQGLQIDFFGEYDYSPYSCFSNLEEFEPGKFRIKHFGNKIPMVYTIKAHKSN